MSDSTDLSEADALSVTFVNTPPAIAGDAEAAAAYLGLTSTSMFLDLVKEGFLPQPKKVVTPSGSVKLWGFHELEAAFMRSTEGMEAAGA